MIVIFFFEQRFNRVSKFFARFASSRHESNIRDFQLAVIVDPQSLGIIVPIFDHSEADIVI